MGIAMPGAVKLSYFQLRARVELGVSDIDHE